MALWMALSGWAQSTIRVDVHSIVEVSERFNVVFIVEGESIDYYPQAFIPLYS